VLFLRFSLLDAYPTGAGLCKVPVSKDDFHGHMFNRDFEPTSGAIAAISAPDSVQAGSTLTITLTSTDNIIGFIVNTQIDGKNACVFDRGTAAGSTINHTPPTCANLTVGDQNSFATHTAKHNGSVVVLETTVNTPGSNLLILAALLIDPWIDYDDADTSLETFYTVNKTVAIVAAQGASTAQGTSTGQGASTAATTTSATATHISSTSSSLAVSVTDTITTVDSDVDAGNMREDADTTATPTRAVNSAHSAVRAAVPAVAVVLTLVLI